MADPILHENATVQCLHAGQARPVTTSTRVKVGGQAIVMQPHAETISGCTLNPNAGGPCVTAQWTSAAKRVRSENLPVLLKTSQATCVPTGTGLNILTTQTRVTAQ